MLFYWLSTKSKQLISFLQLAWAPGKGVKGKEYKEYFDTEQGVAYIPWKKLANGVDFQALSDGGWIDPETLPPGTQNTSKEGQFYFATFLGQLLHHLSFNVSLKKFHLKFLIFYLRWLYC